MLGDKMKNVTQIATLQLKPTIFTEFCPPELLILNPYYKVGPNQF